VAKKWRPKRRQKFVTPVFVKQFQGLLRQLRDVYMAGKTEPRATVVVGYTADYAGFVHENMEAHHNPPTRAGWLREKSRTERPHIVKTVIDALQQEGAFFYTPTMAGAMFSGGMALKRSCEEIIPIETGYLKESGFVRLDDDD
jgi:hypothetical protein